METTYRKEGKAVIVTVNGKVDASTASAFEKSLDEAMGKDEKKIIADLTSLEYISSAGLRVILATAKKLKARQGDIYLAGVLGNVKEVLDMSGFSSIFKIFDNVNSALTQI
ncbi:MAG: STAS domain-containing protein [Desulfobacterales bacterium]|nr:STAS domain-containing protein [Desulfobacterales bacterium]